jgi:acyl-CoA thioester hydrolase
MTFEKELLAGWGDMDFNSHMRNTAYLDKSGDVRMLFFAENGFPMTEFMRLRVGPVVMKDEVEYFREVQLLQVIKGSLALAGISEDGSRFTLCNEFHHADGKLAARVTSNCGWLDLAARRLIAPPPHLLEVMNKLTRTSDFEPLPTRIKNAQ